VIAAEQRNQREAMTQSGLRATTHSAGDPPTTAVLRVAEERATKARRTWKFPRAARTCFIRSRTTSSIRLSICGISMRTI
jgi:hypothetical protein